jgi:AcrR family transcriptional regulator
MPDAPTWLPPRRSRSEETVRRILDAGRESFHRFGYARARVDDIADLAGISHGSFYLYFRNKEDLLHRLAVECSAALRVLTTDLDAMPRPLDPDRLREWVTRFIATYQDDGPVIRIWLDNRDADPLMHELANSSLGPLTAALSRIVAPGLAAALDDGLAGLGLLSMLERLSSYLRDAPQELAAATAARLLFATTLEPPTLSVTSAG